MKRKIMKVLASALALCLAFSMALPVGAKDLSLAPQVRTAVELCEESGGTVLFKDGGANEAWESYDNAWFMNAKDDEVITVIYKCAIEENIGWGVLGWGATVDDVWTDGPHLNASDVKASDEMIAKVTVGELKKALKITDASNVSLLKIGAWNGGQLISVTLSSAEDAPTVEGAKEIVIEAPKELNPEDYLHIFDSASEWPIYIGEYLQYYNPGQTIQMTVELEGNGPFSGGLGICVNKWAWQDQSFESDSENKATVEVFLTPLQDVFYFATWYVGGTQVGVKSITIEKAIDYSDPAAVPEEPARPGYEGNANAAHSGYMDIADSAWWTQVAVPSLSALISNVDPAEITSIVFNGEVPFQLGYNNAGGWTQSEGVRTYTITDMDLAPENWACMIGISRGDGVPYRFTWDVYTNGATPAVDSAQTPANVKTFTFHKDTTEQYQFKVADCIDNVQVGDQVKITVSAAGDPSAGWYGYQVNVGANTLADNGVDATWTNKTLQTYSKENLTDSITITIPYGSGWNTVQLETYDVQGSDVEVTVTVEKLN